MEKTPEYYHEDASLTALAQYMREVRWQTRLTREEEACLIRRIARGKVERTQPCPDQWVLMLARQARDRLVEDYQGLVTVIARRYVKKSGGMDSLI